MQCYRIGRQRKLHTEMVATTLLCVANLNAVSLNLRRRKAQMTLLHFTLTTKKNTMKNLIDFITFFWPFLSYVLTAGVFFIIGVYAVELVEKYAEIEKLDNE